MPSPITHMETLGKGKRMGLLDVFLGVVRCVFFLYDVVSYPVYFAIQQTWKDKTKQNLGTIRCTKESNEMVSYIREKGTSPIYTDVIVKAKVDTVSKAFNYAVKKFGTQECLGTREVLGEADETQKNGKVFKKLDLGNYQWLNYNQVHASTLSFGAGLRSLGIEPKSIIAIYAETRAEWMMSCLGAFSQDMAVATVYTNLGDEAVAHALNETQVKVVVTSHELLPKFKVMLEKLPEIRHVIVMEDQLHPTVTTGFKEGVAIHQFRSVVTRGADCLASSNEYNSVPATPESTAIVMYTSGSTGTPKGVVLTHKNLVATMKSLMFMVTPVPGELYLAYLPLAHVLELLSENCMMLFGIKVGYSNPNTMTDMSTKVRKGSLGDASVLQPTMMCAVPLILDRIYKNITDSVKKRGPVFERVFKFCVDYKLWWYKRGRETPLVDRLVFNKIRALLGGHMRFIIVGGAPLSNSTHDFIRTCLGSIIVQGYSLTESCCTGTVMENRDVTCGTVGSPMTDVETRLVDWEEGNYKVTDRPNPRGEIVMGGETIAKGYFNQAEITESSFFMENGKRWFRTGDIGEMDKTGTLRIIDRKKDLVKLQLGEYVSLGKVEALLKTHPLVENICVYGDPFRSFIVALVVPSKIHLESMAHKKLSKVTGSWNDLCEDQEVEAEVLKQLTDHAKKSKQLEKFEIPQALTLVSEQWTPESGLITASFKMKRKVIQKCYQRKIDEMYG